MNVPGRYFIPDVRLKDPNTDIPERDFLSALFKVGKEKCVEFLGHDLMDNRDNLRHCRNEIMVASSCVLLNKANTQLGDIRDNVGLCRYEIDLSKKYLKEKFENFPEDKLETWLESLSLSIKSFV